MTSIFHNADNLTPEQVGTGWRLCTVEEVRTKLPADADRWEVLEGHWFRSLCRGESGHDGFTYRTRTPLPRTATPLQQIRRIYAAATPRQQAAVRRWAGKI
jgi:hypothetical protein